MKKLYLSRTLILLSLLLLVIWINACDTAESEACTESGSSQEHFSGTEIVNGWSKAHATDHRQYIKDYFIETCVSSREMASIAQVSVDESKFRSDIPIEIVVVMLGNDGLTSESFMDTFIENVSGLAVGTAGQEVTLNGYTWRFLVKAYGDVKSEEKDAYVKEFIEDYYISLDWPTLPL